MGTRTRLITFLVLGLILFVGYQWWDRRQVETSPAAVTVRPPPPPTVMATLPPETQTLPSQIPAPASAPAGSNTDIFAAIKSNNVKEVRRLLAAGADIHGKDDHGAEPLILAAVSGSKEIAELLIARGADVNVREQSGFTPLHGASYQSHSEVAELLVRKGAEVNARSTAGWTPLHKAMESLLIQKRHPTRHRRPMWQRW